MASDSILRNAILKATDGKLRSDNWQYILDVCDLVKEDPEDGGPTAVKIVQERLRVTDANVVLRTLSLVVSLAENCGSRLQQAISSKTFTKELFGLIESSKVHWLVKKEVAKTVSQLSDSFKRDPSLRAMQDLYLKVNSQAPDLLEEQNVPRKTEMTAQTKRNEEKELEEALRLSILEYENSSKSANESQQAAPETARPAASNNAHISSSTGVRKVRALHNLTGRDSEELSFRKGDVIAVIEQVYRDWWRGSLRGRVGIFPLNYVTPVAEKSPRELEKAHAEEEAVLNRIGDVDKLHQLLNSSRQKLEITQDQEVSDLYSSVTPLRPQVTKMLGGYAQKKEEYTSLRKVLADAEASYSQLLSRASQAYTSPPAQNSPPEHMRMAQQWQGQTRPLESHRQTQGGSEYVHAQPYLAADSRQQPYQQTPASHQQQHRLQQYEQHQQYQNQQYQSQVPYSHEPPVSQPQRFAPSQQGLRPQIPRQNMGTAFQTPNYEPPYPISSQSTGFGPS
ncbi:LAME_0G16028g1_1 [Lachancea meyersii CBS 8951]|uniref:Class E vacuolar protein-sorting machinery protein HSE1 n=1 Tax=Lachancea meyersii CBS 8951 TaxID=1266667 RepID=A0A1G4KB34_9SACH|nr:LAME_0G16028g1_1 [Lachancea meyersii CBS 8951]